MNSSIANRAAGFLETSHPGPHKDKRIARELGVSPGMAKLLRTGRGWTLARLDQAVLLHGRSFGDHVFSQLRTADTIQVQLDKVQVQLDKVGAQLRELLNLVRGDDQL
jgi:hypothetical protein